MVDPPAVVSLLDSRAVMTGSASRFVLLDVELDPVPTDADV